MRNNGAVRTRRTRGDATQTKAKPKPQPKPQPKSDFSDNFERIEHTKAFKSANGKVYFKRMLINPDTDGPAKIDSDGKPIWEPEVGFKVKGGINWFMSLENDVDWDEELEEDEE